MDHDAVQWHLPHYRQRTWQTALRWNRLLDMQHVLIMITTAGPLDVSLSMSTRATLSKRSKKLTLQKAIAQRRYWLWPFCVKKFKDIAHCRTGSKNLLRIQEMHAENRTVKITTVCCAPFRNRKTVSITESNMSFVQRCWTAEPFSSAASRSFHSAFMRG